ALPQSRLALGLRDIIDAPEVVMRRWEVEGAYEAIERFYDLVLVYGSQDVFDLAAQYCLPQRVAQKVRYCGYLCTPAVARHPARTRAQYTPDAAPWSQRRAADPCAAVRGARVGRRARPGRREQRHAGRSDRRGTARRPHGSRCVPSRPRGPVGRGRTARLAVADRRGGAAARADARMT